MGEGEKENNLLKHFLFHGKPAFSTSPQKRGFKCYYVHSWPKLKFNSMYRHFENSLRTVSSFQMAEFCLSPDRRKKIPGLHIPGIRIEYRVDVAGSLRSYPGLSTAPFAATSGSGNGIASHYILLW
ncbi:MAG: hypothetical protein CO189_00405 [candidate division Zixibacteria bacterium CG_4_9_14_3_um_filter_46_8]|nr:MAG: hypothetical protein CO189_00405 [candidate division Zixibacteria bacterium CG_4_9_14_3_um_filter_46_8]